MNPETAHNRPGEYFARIKMLIGDLSPGYFAMVMATGIVSIACHFIAMQLLAISLFWLNLAVFIILGCCNFLRILWFRKRVLNDLLDHVRGMGFFTGVAATSIIAVQFIVLFDNFQISLILCIAAIVLWMLITYTVFTNITIKPEKPSFAEGINGSWLLAVVATQSLAVLSARLSMHYTDYKLILNFFAFSMWLWSGMMYIWMISLIFYRYAFFKFSPGDLTPPYWINMGAMAISVLAGSLLIMNTPDAPFLYSTLAFLKGFTIFYWATGTWWIPMLFILAIWRHVYKKFPLKYDPLYWGAVFPLGMYTASTFEMAKAMDLDFLLFIPKYFIYIALVAWAVTFWGFIQKLIIQLSKD